MGSKRLRGKSLLDVNGEPLLLRVLKQVNASSKINDLIVATTDQEEDDAIKLICKNNNYKVITGSKDNVLSRYYKAANSTNAKIIVRITGDCPLIAPDTIDEVIEEFLNSGCYYACNTNPYSRSEGQDVEVFSYEALKKSVLEAYEAADLEHVTLFLKKNRMFSKHYVIHKFYEFPDLKLSVDNLDDLEYIRGIFRNLEKCNKNDYFYYEEIVMALKSTEPRNDEYIINEGLYLSILESSTSDPARKLILDKSEELLKESNNFIPGGAQTYSKSWRPHIRGVTPIFLDSGQGSIVKDVDGNEFIDLIQGLLPNILGYANKEVNQAVFDSASRGHCFSLPHKSEVKLARKLCEIIPCAEKVRFGKNGSDATAGAVRAARAFTNRENVAICGYHGWQDWFIGSTSRKAGVPKGTIDLVHKFKYNDINNLEKVLNSRPNQFAAVILEPVNFFWPDENYLLEVKKLTHKHGAILIFDEICSGFHFGIGGAQKIFGVSPDLATFGKAMGNGWPISCVVGKSEIMNIFEDAFFSFTFAGDIASVSAALKVIEILEEGSAYANMKAAGKSIYDGAIVMAKACGLQDFFKLNGHHNWAIFDFIDEKGESDPVTRALWVQEVTRRGILLLTTFNISASIDQHCVNEILKAFAHAFKRIKYCKEQNINPLEFLDGPIPVPAFKAR